ncbi:MAG: 3'-5' exonuclease, partial [Acidimicrobiia bacterium]
KERAPSPRFAENRAVPTHDVPDVAERHLGEFLDHPIRPGLHPFGPLLEADPQRVNLLTFHSTKGLEFSRVYVVGVEGYQVPGYYAMAENR